ncbi:sensor histidine kinase [Wohlfahrtiimonas populi]|uniref:sensor histidine kinase n=1 Tax=Wohlfahrtiimonas populi TaxID=1940240 RepID=UPI00098D495F|nr:7TM diverse intracellular signaling domain-containing protein [Wohlfahrtiimonas populi]
MGLFRLCLFVLLVFVPISFVFAKDTCSVIINDSYAIPGEYNHIPAKNQNWLPIRLPDTWRDRWPNQQGVWYRVDWQLICPNKNAVPEALSLTINRISMTGKVYINHDLIWQDNSLIEPFSRNWNNPMYWPISPSSIHIGHNSIYVYVAGLAIDAPGLGDMTLGKTTQIFKIYEENVWAQRTIFIINVCLSLTLGAISTCIWFFRRQEQAFGFFGLSTIFWSGFIYNILAIETSPLPNSYIFLQMNMAFFLAYIYCFCVFTWRFLQKKYHKVERAFLGLNCIFLFAIFITPNDLLARTTAVAFYSNFLIFFINLFVVLYLSYRKRSLETYLLATAVFGCLILSVVDLLSLLRIIPLNVSILPYSSGLISIFFTVTLSLHLTKSLKRIEQFNQELNQKIVETTHDLARSLNQQHKLALENNQLQNRLALSHELHDGLGSTLTHAITSVNYHKDHNLNKSQVLVMLKTLNNDLRQIVDLFKGDQQPLPESPELWLAPLRHRFNLLFNELSIQVIWDIESEWKIEPTSKMCSLLYRILEESMSNIIKHSQASLVHITFQYDQDKIIFNIQDNGVGFDVSSVFSSRISVGLQSIKNRVEQLNGQLLIHSKPQQTTIQIII